MKKIPSDFTYNRYGLTCRLVQEEDASFILKLRTDAKLSRFVHEVEDNLSAQVRWIRDYKKREDEGKEYYFIYYSKEKPIGVNRIYNITEECATGGSWICSRDSSVEQSIPTDFILTEIEEMFGIPMGPFNVSKGNNHVLKYHLGMGAKIIGENDEEYTLVKDMIKYNKSKNRYIKLLNLKD